MRHDTPRLLRRCHRSALSFLWGERFTLWLASLVACGGIAEAGLSPPVTVRMQQPRFQQGLLTTELGGILEQGELRIQARKISYRHTLLGGPASSLVAEGDLAVELQGRLFVGERLEYDFLTREGVVERGRTQYGPWYLAGERILLHANHTFEVEGARISTCEQQRQAISLAASKLRLRRDGAVQVENLRVKLFEWPLIWFPQLVARLKELPRFPVHYKFYWRGPQGPMASMRYRLASWTGGYAGLRLDYILRRGWGGALEFAHQSPEENVRLLSHNYVVTDNRLDCPCVTRRYRVEGLVLGKWPDGRTTTRAQWDKLSDPQMASDYPESYFDLQVPLRTEIYNTLLRERFQVCLDGRLRVNRFQSINQLLPAAAVAMHPLVFPPHGGYFTSPLRLAFQDYQYARGTPIRNFHSGRFSYHPTLGRSWHFGPTVLHPEVGLQSVLYTDSPQDDAACVLQGTFSCDWRLPLQKAWQRGLHTLAPYLHWGVTTSPGIPFRDYYLFDIRDGFQQMNILRPGCCSTWHSWGGWGLQSMRAEVYADAFLVNSPYTQRIPKAYLALDAEGSDLSYHLLFGWDFVHHLVDTCNMRLGWTLSEDLALSLDFRHRSAWAWRKCNFDNYVLDCSVPPEELVRSPLSDRRSALQGSAFMRFTPRLSTRVQAYANWDRVCEPSNHGLRIEVFTLLQCNIMFKAMAELTNLENRFSISLALTNKSQSPRPLNPFKVIR